MQSAADQKSFKGSNKALTNRNLPARTTTKMPNLFPDSTEKNKISDYLASILFFHLSPPNLAFEGNRKDASVLCSDPLFHPLSNSAVKNCRRPVLNIFSNSQLFERQKHQCWLEFVTLSVWMCLTYLHSRMSR